MNPEKQNKYIQSLIQKLTKTGNQKHVHLFFQKYHEADIAESLSELDKETKLSFLSKLTPEIASDILEEMELSKQIELISTIKTDLAAKYIEEMEADDAVDLLEELYESNDLKANEILNALPQKEAKDIKTLLSYEEGSAGSIMTTEYISIPENLTIRSAIKKIKAQSPPDSEASYYIYIINDKNKLMGYTTLRDLLLSDLDTKLSKIRNDHPITINVYTDQEEVAKMFQKYNMAALPVINKKKHLLGIITIDDIVDVVVEEATEDLYKLSGTTDINEIKLISGKRIYAIKSRLPWLILTITGGLLAAFIINTYASHFKDTLFSLSLSLSFIPLLMGLGGNVGSQSSTITVRGLSTGTVKSDQPGAFIIREYSIGLYIGLIISLAVLIVNLIAKQSLVFSLIVSTALMTNITAGALLGASLPILLKKLSIDPAVASGPFISTSLDILGQLIYFSITLLMIHLLL